MTKPVSLLTAVALTLTTALSPAVTANAATSARAHAETQGQMIRGLLATFDTIPSWPASTPHGIYDFNPKTPNVTNPITPDAWVGLKCVFPTAKSSQYPALLGIHTATPNAPVTAGQAAQWIVDWSVIARKMNLALEPTARPFQLLQAFSVFWGTKITSLNQVLTMSQAAAIRNNLVEACRGWRILARNKIQFLEPFVTIGSGKMGRAATNNDIGSVNWSKWNQAVRYMNYASASALKNSSVFKKEGFLGGPYTRHWKLSDWPEAYGAITALQNDVTLTLRPHNQVRLSIESTNEYGLGSYVSWADANGKSVSAWDQYQLNYWTPKAFGWNSPITIEKGHTYGLKDTHNQTGYKAPTGDGLLFYGTSPFTIYTDTYGGNVMGSTGFEIVYRGAQIVAVNMVPQSNGLHWNTNYPAQVSWGM